MHPRDVLKAWWVDNLEKFFPLNMNHQSFGGQARIECNGCEIAWITSKFDEPFFEYATEYEGDISRVYLADPELFEKLSVIIQSVRHNCREVAWRTKRHKTYES